MRKQFARPLLAVLTAALLVAGPGSPLLAQQPENPKPQASPGNAGGTISLGSAKHNFSNAPKPFPNLIAPYQPISVDPQTLTNSPKIEQLIRDNKLELTLQDAVELALENNIDIAVQRYYPWLADTAILKAKSGGFGGAVPGAAFAGSSANNPLISFDPLLATTLTVDDRTIPINNPLTSGTGTGVSTLSSLVTHTSQFNTQYNQGFATGTTFFTAWNNTRSSSTSRANHFCRLPAATA